MQELFERFGHLLPDVEAEFLQKEETYYDKKTSGKEKVKMKEEKVLITVSGGVAEVASAPKEVDVFIVDKDNIDAGGAYKYNGIEYTSARDAVDAIKEDYKSGDKPYAIISVDGGIAYKEEANVMVDIVDYDNDDDEDEVASNGKELTGKRIRMIEMPDDPDPIKPGEEGEITGVDDLGQIMVKWDNGRTLSLIPEIDKYEIIEKSANGKKVKGKFKKAKPFSVRTVIDGKDKSKSFDTYEKAKKEFSNQVFLNDFSFDSSKDDWASDPNNQDNWIEIVKNTTTKGKEEDQLQEESNLVHRWLKTTTEEYDDWEWDGKKLSIFKDDKLIENYSRKDLAEFIPELKKAPKAADGKLVDAEHSEDKAFYDFRNEVETVLFKKYGLLINDTKIDNKFIKKAMDEALSADEIVTNYGRKYDLTPISAATEVVEIKTPQAPKKRAENGYICVIKNHRDMEIGRYDVSYKDDQYINEFLSVMGVKLKPGDKKEIIEVEQ